MIAGFKAANHPSQVARRGPIDAVDDRATPVRDFAPWAARWAFTLDVAAASHNTKCARYFTRDDDGLQQPWSDERVWCNPPFSDLGAWVAKAWREWLSLDPPKVIGDAASWQPGRAGLVADAGRAVSRSTGQPPHQ